MNARGCQSVGATGREVRVVSDAREMTDAALAAVLSAEARAIEARGAFHIALSGGSTPVPLYRELGRREGLGMGFSRWHVYFGDERFVPHDHADSNYRLAEETLLSHAPIPRSQIGCAPSSAIPPRPRRTTKRLCVVRCAWPRRSSRDSTS